MVLVSAARPALIAAATLACSSGPRLNNDCNYKKSSIPAGPTAVMSARSCPINTAIPCASSFATLFPLRQLVVGQNHLSQVDDSLQVLGECLLAFRILDAQPTSPNQGRPLVLDLVQQRLNLG